MLDCILNQRLYRELRNQRLHQEAGYIRAVVYQPSEACLLDAHEAGHKLKLPAKGNDILRGHSRAEKGCEAAAHGCYILRLILLAEPVDRIEDIVQEMRIDLLCKHPYLAVLEHQKPVVAVILGLAVPFDHAVETPV